MRMADHKVADRVIVTVEENLDIGVTYCPGIGEAFPPANGKKLIQLFLESVERPPQGTAPLLLPAASAIASAIRAPPLNPLDTTPRAVFVDLHLPFGRMQL